MSPWASQLQVVVTLDAPRRLSDFIDNERFCLENRANNLFAHSWARGLRYVRYLDVILTRYSDASANWKTAPSRFADLTQGFAGGTLTAEMQGALVQIYTGEMLLHLEIESFYVFAKIVLDCLAQSVQQTFGQNRGRPLERHSQIIRSLEPYAAGQGLSAPSQELLQLAAELQVHVSGFRDRFVVHLNDPRRTFGTSLDTGGHALLHAGNMLYPRNTDPREMDFGRGRSPVELASILNTYVDRLLSYVASNMSHARGYVGMSETNVGAANGGPVSGALEGGLPYSGSALEDLLVHLDYADHALELRYSARSGKPEETRERLLSISSEDIPPTVLTECRFLRDELRKQLLRLKRKAPVLPDVFRNGFLTVVVQDRMRDLPVARLYVYEDTSPREYPRETELRLDPDGWTPEQMSSWRRLVAEVMGIVEANYPASNEAP